jgi:hypothetical protein
MYATRVIPYLTAQLLGDLVNRHGATVHKMVATGDLPAPDAAITGALPDGRPDSRESQPLWSHEAIERFFAHSNTTQGILVPGSDLARDELDRYGVYACPAVLPRFVGLARPVLAGVRIDGIVTVYPVTTTFSDGPVGPAPDPAQRALLAKLNQGRDDEEPLTVFGLDKGAALGTFVLTNPLRQGRIVQAEFLREALHHGTVTDISRLEITPS